MIRKIVISKQNHRARTMKTETVFKTNFMNLAKTTVLPVKQMQYLGKMCI